MEGVGITGVRPGIGSTVMEKGIVLTANEVEGYSPAADWSRWTRSGRAPRPEGESRFARSWAEDLEQLAGLGITSLQLTLEWADLEPHPGSHDVPAIEFRRELLEASRNLGLKVWACLIDGSLPGWFLDDEGGFLDDRSRNIVWPRHIDWIGEHFGDLVDGWIPQREPLTWALRRYLRAEAPPGRRDPAIAAEAVRAAMLAEGEAWRLLKGTAPVATYQTARAIRPQAALSGGDDIKARPEAQLVERLLWHPWVSSITEGLLIVGNLPQREVDHLRGAFDRVIVELRPGLEIGPEGQWRRMAPDVGAMTETLRRVADELGGHDIVAAGNLAGVADDGRIRPDHVQQMLDATQEAVEETSVIGWWQSSPIDAYPAAPKGMPQPGLIDYDRTETSAATTFRDHGN